MAREWKAPLHNGSLPHFAHGDASRYDWVDSDITFEAVLALRDVNYGRSARYLQWTVAPGTFRFTSSVSGVLVLDPQTFPMFLTDFVAMVREGVIESGGIAKGQFGFVKRGQNYGIRYVGRTEMAKLFDIEIKELARLPPGILWDEDSIKPPFTPTCKPIFG